jgi:thiosulfate/3-mercaptopyruvate sulfurtransferase
MTFRFVDCRWELGSPGSGRQLYFNGHVPGAAFLDVETDLSAPPATPGGRHPLPAAEGFARAAGAAGIGPGVFVVAYDQGMNGGAARLWWLLRHFGHDDVAVLDGGSASGLTARAGDERPSPASSRRLHAGRHDRGRGRGAARGPAHGRGRPPARTLPR